MASAVAAVDETRHLLAAEYGLYLRGLSDGKLTLLCPLEVEDAGTRSNDGRVHPCGALWISTMGRDAEPGRGAIYHVAGTRVTRLYGSLTIPNAICFSPDGATGYFADTDAGLLKRVSLDPNTGLPTGEPSDALRSSRRGWRPRWRCGRCRGPHLVRPLGGILHRCLQPGGRARADDSPAGDPPLMPHIRRARSRSPADHQRL